MPIKWGKSCGFRLVFALFCRGLVIILATKMRKERKMEYISPYGYSYKIEEWEEISEEKYWEMFEILPPIFLGSGFFALEALTGIFHNYYIKWKGKYYTAIFSRNDTWEKIKESLESFIKE